MQSLPEATQMAAVAETCAMGHERARKVRCTASKMVCTVIRL